MTHLIPQQLSQFDRDGFLVIENLLATEEIQAMWDEYSSVLDNAADEMFAAGKISQRYANLPFDERYMAIAAEDPIVRQLSL